MNTFKWFIPSFAGDFRLELGPDASSCVLKTLKPTPHEQQLLTSFMQTALKKGWVTENTVITPEDQTIRLLAPLEKVGPMLVKATKPRDRTITAVTFKDGKVEVAESSDSRALEALAKAAMAASTSTAAAVQAREATAAASVSRPTPCCPQCIPGAVLPATEALLAFLTPEQHEQWRDERAIVVTGGMSGNRYLLAHRHTKRAEKMGRMCMDLDDRCIVHFHDWSVPPEEEVLAAKLILEHREPWLRNEATLFSKHGIVKYKNPFGNLSDGTEDAGLAHAFGAMLGGGPSND